MKENYGDLKSLEDLGKTKTRPFTDEQLLDENLKNIDGESLIEVRNRMNNFFNDLINDTSWNNVAVVSHGAIIKFFLSQYCDVDKNLIFKYKDKIINITSPCVLKIKIEDKLIKDIEQIY